MGFLIQAAFLAKAQRRKGRKGKISAIAPLNYQPPYSLQRNLAFYNGMGACSGRRLLLLLQFVTDRDDQRRLIGRTLHTDPFEQYFVIAIEGDPLQGLLVRLHPFRLPR